MAGVDFTIDDQEIKRLYNRLKEFDVRTRKIGQVVRAASKPMVKAAKSNVRGSHLVTSKEGIKRKTTGTLRRSIAFIKSRQKQAVWYVGPRRGKKHGNKDAWYAPFVEWGTAIRQTEKGYYRGAIQGKGFMDKAYSSTHRKAINDITKGLTRLVKKLENG